MADRSGSRCSVEFIVHDNSQGRQLTDSLRRRGIHLERPFQGDIGPDLNDHYIVAKIPKRLAGLVKQRVSTHKGMDYFIGVFDFPLFSGR